MTTRKALVVTASTRAAHGEYPDRTGPLLVAALREWGYQVPDPQVVPDGPEVGAALTAAVAAGTTVVITTGGTGVAPTDVTPEQTAPLLDRRLDQLAAAIVARGLAQGVPTAVLSRGLAGVAGSTVVVNLPGSTGGVRDGIAVLEQVLGHLVDQVGGGDH